MTADHRGFHTVRSYTPINLHREAFIDRDHQVTDMNLDVRYFNELPAEIAWIDHFEKIVEQLNDSRSIGKRRRCQMLQFWFEFSEGLELLLSDCRDSGPIR